MTDCSKIPTLTDIENSKKGMNDIVQFAGSHENTYTSNIDGSTRKTVQGVTEDAQDAFRLGAGSPQGNYAGGVSVYEESNWTFTYNGQQWGLSGDFDLSTLPYLTTESDPNNDSNLAVRGDASQEYVDDKVAVVQSYVDENAASITELKTVKFKTCSDVAQKLADGEVQQFDCFGDSTMWGGNTRQHYITRPVQLSKIIKRRSRFNISKFSVS